jgi:type IV pilus assembly protein PilV
MIPPSASESRGFSLIEVMISIVLLSIGLLGNASLQTFLVRQATYTNTRIAANNLAAELQSVALADYGNIASYVVPASATPDCTTTIGVPYLHAWQCRVSGILPTASPLVTWDAATKAFVVTITWNFANEPDAPTHTARLSTLVDTTL